MNRAIDMPLGLYPGTKWTVVGRGPRASEWWCVCECRTMKLIQGSNLRLGKTHGCRSCSASGAKRPSTHVRTRTTSRGYLEAFVWPEHAWYPYARRAHTQGYYRTGLVHRLAMAHHLGRSLDGFETVHHKDGDRTNNALSNLQLRSSNHGPGQRFRCRDCGSSNVGPVSL